jgi:hypothetical protein
VNNTRRTQTPPSDSQSLETIPTTGQDQEKKLVTHTRRNKEGEPWRVQVTRRRLETHMTVAKGGRTGERRRTPLRGMCPKKPDGWAQIYRKKRRRQ